MTKIVAKSQNSNLLHYLHQKVTIVLYSSN